MPYDYFISKIEKIEGYTNGLKTIVHFYKLSYYATAWKHALRSMDSNPFYLLHDMRCANISSSGSYYNCRRGRLQWLKAMKGRYNLSKGAALRKKQKKRPLRGRFFLLCISLNF